MVCIAWAIELSTFRSFKFAFPSYGRSDLSISIESEIIFAFSSLLIDSKAFFRSIYSLDLRALEDSLRAFAASSIDEELSAFKVLRASLIKLICSFWRAFSSSKNLSPALWNSSQSTFSALNPAGPIALNFCLISLKKVMPVFESSATKFLTSSMRFSFCCLFVSSIDLIRSNIGFLALENSCFRVLKSLSLTGE